MLAEKERDPVKVTLIAPSATSGQPQLDLAYAVEEISKIRSAVGKDQFNLLLGEQATVSQVSSCLPTSTWLHLVCHGHQDPEEPLKSCLFLYNGELELGAILSKKLSEAEFVFLSGCETRMGDANLTNESMHLAGAMIFAGFCGAIGTMWGVADFDMPKVANLVYNELFGRGKVPSVTEAANALNVAIQTMRKAGLPLHRWLQFVHIGA